MRYIDMHCDTLTRAIYEEQDLRENKLHIDLLRLKKSNYLLQNIAIFTNYTLDNPSTFCRKVLDEYEKALKKNSDLIRPVYKYEDIEKNDQEGYVSSLLTLEDGAVIDGDLRNLDYYYEKGVRMICLTWNHYNGIGYPNFEVTNRFKDSDFYITNTNDGLTEFGIEYVKRCEELGIIVDVSHLSDKGFYDVLEHTTKPFVASHSNARSVCGVARNLTDDMILKLRDRGGVMGINYCGDFLDDKDPNLSKVKDIVKHINYIKNLAGIDVIGLGSDFDGFKNEIEFKDVSGIEAICDGLRQEGYSEEEIEKICYKNVLRVYKECLK